MELEVMRFITDPVLYAFLILTILAFLWKFLKMWFLSIFTCALFGGLIIIILITIGQMMGADDLIRYLITSHYRLLGTIALSFRDILLLLLLVIAFQLALAGHTLDLEKKIHAGIPWFARRASHHYEMENTLDMQCKKGR
jgi:hypothetical protein